LVPAPLVYGTGQNTDIRTILHKEKKKPNSSNYKKKISAMLNRKKDKEYLKRSMEFLKWLEQI